MTTNVLLLHYNNYFNRQVKKLSTVDAYKAADANYSICNGVNFVPGDGIYTSLVLGFGNNPSNIFDNGQNYDYLVVMDSTAPDYTILSRWFIMEENRTRDGQYEIILRRDVIADNYSTILSAPVYVEKGYIGYDDTTNPFVFNKENLEVNQIKKWEHALKDRTESAWIVGFISSDQAGKTASRKINGVTYSVTIPGTETRVHLTDAPYDMFCIPFDAPSWRYYKNNTNHDWVHPDSDAALAVATALGASLGDTAVYDIQILPYCPIPELQRMSYKHKICFQDDIYQFLDNYEVDYIFRRPDSENSEVVNFLIWCNSSNLSFDIRMLKEEYEPTTTSATTPAPHTYYIINDASLAFDVNIEGSDLRLYKVDRNSKLATDMGYFKKAAGGPMIDGSPINFYTSTAEDAEPVLSIPAVQYKNSGFYYMIYTPGTVVTSGSNASLRTVTITDKFGTVLGLKQSNDLDVYRLASNNFQAIFEFSPAKANGFTGFNIDYTYLPNQPYIHISPIMSGLYGENFNKIDDLRGLVDTSNHSVAKLSSAWANYVQNNSMYQKIFDRQIENMDTLHSYDRVNKVVGAIAGTVTGAASGAASGAVMGGGAGGAAIGGVVGGVASLVGGVTDVVMSENIYKENRDYAIDNFNYSLQNIKAIPASLAKTTSFVYNTRYYPFLEFYTCTAQERAAYVNKLTYDGMTIMAIDTLNHYLFVDPHFFKGEIIRLPNLQGDSHMANEIYNEIKKGVYI